METPRGAGRPVCVHKPLPRARAAHTASLQSSSSQVRNRASLLGLQAFHELHLPSPGMQQPGASGKRQQDPCTRCPALTQPAFKGLTQLCLFPLPLFSPSWATLSSLVAS